MMPHDLGEVCGDHGPPSTIRDHHHELMNTCWPRTFRPAASIYGLSGVREGFSHGCGGGRARRNGDRTDEKGGEAIIITEIPYQVNKAMLVAKIAELVNEKKVLGISDVRDESSREGVRRRSRSNAMRRRTRPPHAVKLTPLQTMYGINNNRRGQWRRWCSTEGPDRGNYQLRPASHIVRRI